MTKEVKGLIVKKKNTVGRRDRTREKVEGAKERRPGRKTQQ